jgi:lipopolysaccharide biosynthesis protein
MLDVAMTISRRIDGLRTIAFYLPQFHPIAENDAWWGKGFTEWTNVRKAQPNFIGHYQSHVPAELGYYDLRDPAVREAQAQLALEHGINGFCYYYYWFNGRRLLEAPLNDMVASGTPDFPFCICWANENWTRRWDGLEHEVLMAQHYTLDGSRQFIRSLKPLFQDERYIRVDGRPLLLIYKAGLIPDIEATVAMWRAEARAAGFDDLYLVACQTTGEMNPVRLGFDAGVEFPPHRHHAVWLNARVHLTNPVFGGLVTSYRAQVVQALSRPPEEFKLFRSVFPGWDNTARRQDQGTVFVGSAPEIFEHWVAEIVTETLERFHGDERLVFVNAWNEWGEGCHLEPDLRYGRQYLEALRRATHVDTQMRKPTPRRRTRYLRMMNVGDE